MRIRFTTALLSGAVLLASGPAARAQLRAASPGPESFVLTEKDAVLLDLPELAAPGLVTQALWSPSGKYVLTAREKMDVASVLKGNPSMESGYVLWSMATRQRRDLWKSTGGPEGIEPFHWLGQSDVALAVINQPAPPPRPGAGPQAAKPAPERWVLRIDAARGTARALLKLPLDSFIDASPHRPVAALYSRQEKSFRLISADGAIRDLSPLVSRLMLGPFIWSEDGSRLEFDGAELPDDPKQRPRFARHSLDLASGRLTRRPERPPVLAWTPRPAPSGPFRLRSGTLTARQDKASQDLHPLWLEVTSPTEQPLALVSGNSPEGLLSPRMDAVLYTSEGAAWVRPLLRIDKAVYYAARNAAERARLSSNMKQVGLGVMMYAQDFDETLPGAGSDLETLLDPYIKNRTVFEGLVYTFPGGPLRDVPEPAKTQLGYVPAPGGRILLFVDGHVQFEPGTR